MGRIDELVSEEFARWEQRGRGWKVWPETVQPEPAFEEFTGYRLPQAQLERDDGRRPGLLASLFDSLEKKLNRQPPPLPDETVEPEPAGSSEALASEFIVSLPASLDLSDEPLRAFLDSFQDCAEPTGFELAGSHENITVQFASSSVDAPALERRLNAFFPTLSFTPTQETLAGSWHDNDGIGFIVDFGLAHEFMLPLQTGHSVDPFVGLVAVLNELQQDELAVFQILFQPVQNRWPASVWRSVTDANSKAIFLNRPHLIPGTKEKLETPLFGVVVRAAAKASEFERAAVIVRDMASALRTFSRVERNRLIPLHNEEYLYEAHEADLVCRQSRRSGMLLNRDELLGFVHLPSDEVRAPKLCRERTHTKAAPASALFPAGIVLGQNQHAGRTASVYLSAEQRTRHIHIIGASGTGKSTLLFNLIRQDIENGDGVAMLDPHGDLVERILGVIPDNRIDDVIVVDPSDEEYSVGFNILHAHSNLERTLLASDLVSVFRRFSTSWGDQMDAVLKNAILAFLNSSRRGTMADLRRFLVEPNFRDDYLTSVQDPEVVYYWQRAFPLLAGNKSVGPILTRLNNFLESTAIRFMISQPESRLDFAAIMDTGKIFLAKLPKGLAGEKDCYLLGSLLVSKFQQVAMSRQAQQAEARRDFWIYADEFDNFITPSMAEILKGTRKYRVGLTLAHHQLQQLQRDPDVASAVANASTRVVLRVGDEDARKLSEGFASFEARDLQNLGDGEAICRFGRSEFDFNLKIPLPEAPNADAAEVRKRAITASRKKYAVPRADIEAVLRQQLEALRRPKPEPPKPAVVDSKASEVLKPEVPPVVRPPVQEETPSARPKRDTAKAVEVPETIQPVVSPSAIASEAKEVPQTAIEPLQTKLSPPPKQTAEIAPGSSPPQPLDDQAKSTAEVRNEAMVETKEALAASPPVIREAPAPRNVGRGRLLHQTIQKRLQSEANQLGFIAPIEKDLSPVSRGAADLVLKKEKVIVAVELGIGTSTHDEFENVQKCLAAGFNRIAAVSLESKRLEALERAVRAALGPEQVAQVGYFTPEGLIDELKRLASLPEAQLAPSAPKKRVVGGYKMRRSGPKLPEAERRPKESVAIAIMRQILNET